MEPAVITFRGSCHAVWWWVAGSVTSVKTVEVTREIEGRLGVRRGRRALAGGLSP